MRHFTLILALGLATGAFALRSLQFEERLADVESRTRTEQGEIQVLRTRVLEAQAEAERSRLDFAALARKNDEALQAGQSLAIANASFETELLVARRTIEAHADKLRAFETSVQATEPDQWKQSFDSLQETLDEKWDLFGGGVQRMQGLAQENRELLKQLDERLDRNVETMWSKLMGPTVQLSGATTVGSGVLLESIQLPGDEGYKTHVLTAWHVVRDILADSELLDGPIPVTMYSREGAKQSYQASLLHFDADIDSALLELDSRQPVPFGAKLASRTELNSMRIFSNVYAAGCPLGNDPIPTFGEIADTRHVVDNEHYWMISAPTFVGNSGGGIFDAESFDLIGIFSKIYTHGTLRPTVIPHMGLSTPLSVIYEWFEEIGYGHLVPPDTNPTPESSPTIASATIPQSD